MSRIKDITSIQDEIDKLHQREKLLNQRFVALTLDHHYYLSVSEKEDKLFFIRNNIFYRFYSCDFHIRHLLQSFNRAQNDLYILFEEFKQKNTDAAFLQTIEVNRLVERTTFEISSLFDSIIYHLSSIFDYIGNITNYIFGESGSKEQALKWSSLASSVRDVKHPISKLGIAKVITKLDNEFVDPLYKHRSNLIHKYADICHLTITLSNDESDPMKLRFMSTSLFSKNFAELRKLSKEFELTQNYVLFWLFNKAFDTIKEILFALRKDIINSGTLPFERDVSKKKLIFMSFQPDNNTAPPSTGLWELENPL